MVKPNPWLLSVGIFVAFGLVTHHLLDQLNDAWNIW